MEFHRLLPLQALGARLLFEKRKILVVWPRQEGKTQLGVELNNACLGDASTGPRNTLFLAKNKSSAQKAARQKFNTIFDPKLFKVNTTTIISRTNPLAIGYIDSVDKDPDRIRGGSYHLVHWTEMAFSRFEHGVTCSDVYDKVVAPAIRKVNGFFFGETTLNGMNSFRTFWDNAENYGITKVIVSLSQLLQMGLVSEQYYNQTKKETHPDVFRQEYECEWVTFAGRMYHEFADRHVHPIDPPRYASVICGLDWGYEDATCVLFAYVREGHVYIFDEVYGTHWTLEMAKRFIDEKMQDYGLENIVVFADHNKQQNAELAKRGIQVEMAEKQDVLGNRMQVKELLWQDRIHISPKCRFLIKDLGAATWHPVRTNEIDESQCSWGHFDAESALRYLVRAALEFESVDKVEEVEEYNDRNRAPQTLFMIGDE